MNERYKNIKKYRLKNWNYANNGFYFITICTYEKQEYFGNINNNKMELNWCGKIAMENLIKTFKNFNNFYLNNCVIMPNHIHLMIEINDAKFNNSVGTGRFEKSSCSTQFNHKSKFGCVKKRSISTFIQTFKSNTTKQIDKIEPNYFKWQPRFHDHIIRNEKDYINHVIYIENNIRNYNNNYDND